MGSLARMFADWIRLRTDGDKPLNYEVIHGPTMFSIEELDKKKRWRSPRYLQSPFRCRVCRSDQSDGPV